MTLQLRETIRARFMFVVITACAVAAIPIAMRVPQVLTELSREKHAEALYQEGLMLGAAWRFDEAAETFRDALAADPDGALTAVSLGELAGVEILRRRYENAIEAYEQLLQIFPYMYYPNLWREFGLVAFRAGRYDEAAEHLLRGLTVAPDDWRAQHLLGHTYYRLGDRKAAGAAWTRVLELRPEHTPAREWLDKLNDDK